MNKFSIKDIEELVELAKQFTIKPSVCQECKREFYPFFFQRTQRYERYINGEVLKCIDHTPTDLIVMALSGSMN